MALSDGPASVTQFAQALKFERARKDAVQLAADAEAARLSEVRVFTDDLNSIWHYVVIDGAEIRIEKCESTASKLVIPEKIEDKPVVAIAAEACADLLELQSVDMPDSISSIGQCAFRGCDNLREVHLPANVSNFDSGWFRGCRNIYVLTLPGKLEKITGAIFDIPNLKSLIIGAHTVDIMPAAFANSNLESVKVVPENEYLVFDEGAIYSKDGHRLIALCIKLESFTVKNGCREIACKGFSNFATLREIILPDSVEVIEDFAYAKCGINSFLAPESLRSIGKRAFYGCKNLTSVTLNDGLETIGQDAFSDTSITELFIPKTVKELNIPIAENTSISFCGTDKSLHIDALSPYLFLDDNGGLYIPGENMTLLKMLNPKIEDYEVQDKTTHIAPAAFSKHKHIEKISFPETLACIGEKAFRDCSALIAAPLPSSLKEISDEAFLNTNICSINIPASIERIGALALITEGAYKGQKEPSLKEIVVDVDNKRYRMEGSMLIESFDSGVNRVVVCTGQDVCVSIPKGVTAIASYAFSGLRNIKEIELSDEIVSVDMRGLSLDCLPCLIRINLKEPKEGHEVFEIRFPQTSRGFQHLQHAFGLNPFVNVEAILAAYDNTIVNASSFDSATEASLDAYEQVQHLLSRLKDPIFMSQSNKNLAISVLEKRLKDFCIEIARHDNKSLFDKLIDLNIINEQNIDSIIEVVTCLKDATVTNYLLDAKRNLSGNDKIDFDAMFEL